MKIAIFVRHGQSHSNSNYTLSDSNEGFPLTSLGVSQVESTAKELKRLRRVDSLYTSPVQRAVQTSEIIGREIGIQPRIDSRLRERGMGGLNNIKFDTPEDVNVAFRGEIRSNYSKGMESWSVLKTRMSQFMDALPDGTLTIAVSHHDLIKAAVAHVHAKYDDDLMPYDTSKLSYALITVIDLESKALVVLGSSSLPESLVR